MSNYFWNNLLEYIDAQRVVPVFGPELLVTQVEERNVLLHRYIAERVAQEFDIAMPAELPEDDALNFVVCRFLDDHRCRREDIYPVICRLMKAPLTIPEPLRKLARISHFNLFVTTSFDSLLEKALAEERPQIAPKVKSLAYSPNNVEDLDQELRSFDGPVVYHLLGRVSASPDYVITEEDTLEFFSSLQAESRRPEKLFDELKRNHLLIIGSSFPDWLARFFIRIAKGSRLSMQREPLEIIADHRTSTDKNLVLFLEHFSYRTEIFEGGAVEFVNELSKRYQERHPPGETPTVLPATDVATAASPGRTIFLSYTRKDAAAAEKIRNALANIGWDVWFDKSKLEGGDYFDSKIEQSIRKCALFLPVISANTQAIREGYFRGEWRMAMERVKYMDDSLRFIIPLAIDDTPASEDACVPPKFLNLLWSRLPGGEPTPEFIEKMKNLLREQQKRQKGFK